MMKAVTFTIVFGVSVAASAGDRRCGDPFCIMGDGQGGCILYDQYCDTDGSYQNDLGGRTDTTTRTNEQGVAIGGWQTAYDSDGNEAYSVAYTTHQVNVFQGSLCKKEDPQTWGWACECTGQPVYAFESRCWQTNSDPQGNVTYEGPCGGESNSHC
jgi:hypothetical protein